MYYIRNIHQRNYYQKHLWDEIFHFVSDFREAKSFKTKKEANKIINLFKHKENLEVIKMSNRKEDVKNDKNKN